VVRGVRLRRQERDDIRKHVDSVLEQFSPSIDWRDVAIRTHDRTILLYPCTHSESFSHRLTYLEWPDCPRHH